MLPNCECGSESGSSLCRVFPLASALAARLQLPTWQQTWFFPFTSPPGCTGALCSALLLSSQESSGGWAEAGGEGDEEG